ncbi:signal transduction histidine kinase [Sphingomonas vulcanisoli]|uniref:histidine kinase n=1 Tax=Sphingomonas vulcanisoli TaxID=1658060 RepID=A0ABX0TM73_9SPHN|nr:ATP-binding protein [Sphingomonas vulcanisoli]NIJ06546.1 signal transduction histidine kinase [Sphingomonas vulcanisoli]
MSPHRPRLGGPPLALQILAMLLAGLLVAQLVTLILTVLLPPAPAAQYGLDDIAARLAGAEGGKGTQQLQRIVQNGPPDVKGAGWLVSERSQTELAHLMGVDPGRVSLAFYTPLPFAGTAQPRTLAMNGEAITSGAMANDSFVQPAAWVSQPRPGSLLVLAQFAPPPGAAAAMARFGMVAPPHDSIPQGALGHGPGVGPGANVMGEMMRSDHARPLINMGAIAARHGELVITGDGGAAVPALLRGRSGTSTANIVTPPITTEQAAAQITARALGGVAAGADAAREAQNLPISPRAALNGPIARFGNPATDNALLATPALQLPRAAVAAPLLSVPTPVPTPPRTVPQRTIAAPAPAPVVTAAPVPLPALGFTPVPEKSTALQPQPQAHASQAPAGPPIAIAPTRRSLFGLAQAPFVQGDFVAALRLSDGKWAVVQPAPEPFPNSWQRRVLLWFAIALAIVVPLGWLFARRLVKPLDRFAGAAEKLGRDPAAEIGPLDGPAEIGRAAHAFNLMQNRLRAFVDDRTAMIGAISHDLRTPLTRMRFRIEDVEAEDVREGLLEEVDEMEAMIAQVIDFIRDASAPARRERLDLNTIVDEVVEDARLVGGDVVIERAEQAQVEVDVLGLRRLLDNLIENAIKYGDRARIRLHRVLDEAVIEVFDDGPGLPADEMDRVFEPFYRSEAARNSDKAGSGLGLAVCRSIARAHGGDIRLKQSEDGFSAELRVPLVYGSEKVATS